MEGEVCHFQKFGYCKFRESCKIRHFSQVCESLSRCNDVKHCPKIHPRSCKRFASKNGCRHNEECAYNHNDHKQLEEDNNTKEKVSRLEKMVDDLTKKVTNQETEKTEKAKELDKVVKALVRKVLSLESDMAGLET